MAEYTYDESGAVFNFFLLAVLTTLLLPATYWGLVKGRKASGPVKKQTSSSRSWLWTYGLAAGWALFAIVAYRAATMEIVESQESWNPWDILGVDMSADKAVIKKAFRSLSLQYHPDKFQGEDSDREASEKKFVDVSKAYKVLSDEEAMKIWKDTGNPDGTNSMKLGLALPKWLVDKDNNILVLFVYALAFGIGLPFMVARWWYSSKEVNNSKILNSTMGLFYRDMKENSTFKSLMDVISKAEEFGEVVSWTENSAKEVDELVEEIRTSLVNKTSERFERTKKSKDVVSAVQDKTAVLLAAHMARVKPANEELAKEQSDVVLKSVNLVNGLLQIALSRSWFNMVLASIDISQLLVQSLYFRQTPLYQLPHMTPDLLKHFKTKKRSVQTVSELKALSEEDRTSLLRSLEPEQIKEVMAAARKYPIVKLPKVKFVVIGEPAIIPSALVTLIVHIKLADTVDEKVEPLAGDKEEEEEEVQNNKEWWVNNENQTPSVHAPHFPGIKKPVWWVIMGDMRTNRVVTLQKVPDLVKEKRVYLKFAAPPEKGSWDFQVFVKSDSYVGCDVVEEIKLVVQPPEAAPLPEVDDDISEPEDDSIAGQMEVLRKQKSGAGAAPGKKVKKKVAPKPKVTKPPKTYGDAEDSTDSEDEIGAEGGPPKHDHHDHSHDDDSLDLSDNEGFIE